MKNNLAKSSLFLYTIIYLIVLFTPSILIPVFSFNEGVVATFPIEGFSTKWYISVWKKDAVWQALQNSIYVAFIAASVSTFLATLAARALTRYEFSGKNLMTTLILSPLVVPEVLIGVSLLVILNKIGWVTSLTTIIYSHILICTPYGLQVMMGAFEGLDKSLEEASTDLGENSFMTFWRVILPLVAPGIFSCFVLSVMISMDEFILAFFLSGNDTTLPIYMWSQLRFAAELPNVLAIGSVMLAMSLVLLFASEAVKYTNAKRTGTQYGD